MRFENYIDDVPTLNENLMRNMLSKLKGKSTKVVKGIFKNAWDSLVKSMKPQESEVVKIINKNFGTSYRSLDDISKQKLAEGEVNEDWKHWWEMIRQEAFPTLSFYPALTAWIEIGAVLEPDAAVNWKKFGAYALMWAALVSYKYIRDFHKWKKENPEEYFAERPKVAKKAGIKIDNKRTRAGFV